LIEALTAYIKADRPFFGICLGMQLLFEGSEESPGEVGLGVIPGQITKFDGSNGARVPQIAWNGVSRVKNSVILENIASNDLVMNIINL
jgi:imidazoleglycerol phosphate synthase glutamine amidotransferase subunit HisH